MGHESVLEYDGPASVAARGVVAEQQLGWVVTREARDGSRTSWSGCDDLKALAADTATAKPARTLPVIAYFGARRARGGRTPG